MVRTFETPPSYQTNGVFQQISGSNKIETDGHFAWALGLQHKTDSRIIKHANIVTGSI